MNAWFLLDVQKLFDSMAEDTSSANAGAYEVPLGPVLRKSVMPKRDYEVAQDEFEKLLGKKKK